MSFSPIDKGLIQDEANPGAGNDFFGSYIVPTNIPTTFILQVVMTISGRLYTRVSHAGDIVSMDFNGGNSLVANALYTFKLLVHNNDTVNFAYTANGGNISFFRVQEIGTSDSFTA